MLFACRSLCFEVIVDSDSDIDLAAKRCGQYHRTSTPHHISSHAQCGAA